MAFNFLQRESDHRFRPRPKPTPTPTPPSRERASRAWATLPISIIASYCVVSPGDGGEEWERGRACRGLAPDFLPGLLGDEKSKVTPGLLYGVNNMTREPWTSRPPWPEAPVC
jgi:hypothetical protein